MKLLAARNELRMAFPGLSFALDGNLVGHIGEAIAISDFSLKRLPTGSHTHDFITANGTKIQVKTTQQQSGGVGLGVVKKSFEHLLVIQISESETYEILYNGPGRYIDAARLHKKSASLSVSQLRTLDLEVPAHEKLFPNNS